MSTQTTSRAVDANLPRLRRIHEQRTERALADYFRGQGDILVPLVSEGVVSFEEERWNRVLAGVIFDRGKDTATEFGSSVFALLDRTSRALRFAPDLMDPWLGEVAGNSADSINGMVLTNLIDATTDEDPGASAEALFVGLISVRAGIYAVSMTTTFANFGAHDGARAAGGRTKTWRTNSGNPRSSHAALDGETVSLDENFSNGMRWPGDPSGGADEVAGCQCSLEFAA